jgi:toxin ParE1/3/4
MAQRVVWSRRALQDVEAIAEFIALDSPAYAAAAAKRIITQTRVLSRFPRSGRKVPEFDEESILELFA